MVTFQIDDVSGVVVLGVGREICIYQTVGKGSSTHFLAINAINKPLKSGVTLGVDVVSGFFDESQIVGNECRGVTCLQYLSVLFQFLIIRLF